MRADDDATQKLGLDIKIVSTYSDGFFPLGRPTINLYSYIRALDGPDGERREDSLKIPNWRLFKIPGVLYDGCVPGGR